MIDALRPSAQPTRAFVTPTLADPLQAYLYGIWIAMCQDWIALGSNLIASGIFTVSIKIEMYSHFVTCAQLNGIGAQNKISRRFTREMRIIGDDQLTDFPSWGIRTRSLFKLHPKGGSSELASGIIKPYLARHSAAHAINSTPHNEPRR